MNDKTTEYSAEELHYLNLLARNFPDVATATTEIINLEAILNLPKGTEHFLADLHGEYEAFQHVLRNASGSIKRKVTEIFNETLSIREIKELCTLIYYPREKLELTRARCSDEEELNDFYFITINRLVRVCRNVSSKYSRSKVHKALPHQFSFIIEELLHERTSDPNKQAYVDGIVNSIIATERAVEFIVAMCNLIQQLTLDTLHILGDVFDRGPSPDKIMDILCNYHNFDIQWGNHDILWMGAASGSDCCIANVLRVALRYGNQHVIENSYGINLLPLATFAMATYKNDCHAFRPKAIEGRTDDHQDNILLAQMHKAITIIQFKLEAAAIKRHPDFDMNDRLLLHLIDRDAKTITLPGGDTYDLLDVDLPTCDPADPYVLTAGEKAVVQHLHEAFTSSEKLRRHMMCLFRNGCIFSVTNGNLLYHASIPLNADGTLKDVTIQGKLYHGKALLKRAGELIREAYFGCDDPKQHAFALDYVWYLWCGKDSPAFDKDKMTTFERYLIADKKSWHEQKGYYYALHDDPAVCDRILDEFGVTGQFRHIINGHVPVKAIKGEKPVKAGGKLMVIDGGFSKAYQPETGIAGYTLVYHSRGFQLVQHEPFTSITKAIEECQDIVSTHQIVELADHRMLVKDTDKGESLRLQIADLKKLLKAYRDGEIKERAWQPITNKV